MGAVLVAAFGVSAVVALGTAFAGIFLRLDPYGPAGTVYWCGFAGAVASGVFEIVHVLATGRIF